jgi:ppGpp synthetase/RelA/SpoT-type nucleotidyltranferase
MMPSKTAIDRAGRALAKGSFASDEERLRHEAILDAYRQAHLEPLTSTTLQLQSWMSGFKGQYYIAQRLKRKPQIIRKLQRLPGRLVQLQDIAGARIVVKSNSDVDRLARHLSQSVAQQTRVTIDAINDYRTSGREDSGYRALHVVLLADQRSIELQLRSEAQHYWAEQIERTSVIYGHHLKELEGDRSVLDYFQVLSDVFHDLESGREPAIARRMELESARAAAEAVIRGSDRRQVFDSAVSEGVVKAMIGRLENRPGAINNWIMVFDWNTGSFIYFEPVDRDPVAAMAAYVAKESQFLASDGYEVVMVGSSDPSMIRHTHSHYFGIENYDNVLESLKDSIEGISKRLPIGIDALKVLQVLVRRKHWSRAKMVSRSTLKNHFCKSVQDFESAIDWLTENQLVKTNGKDGLFLDIQQKSMIEAYL